MYIFLVVKVIYECSCGRDNVDGSKFHCIIVNGSKRIFVGVFFYAEMCFYEYEVMVLKSDEIITVNWLISLRLRFRRNFLSVSTY